MDNRTHRAVPNTDTKCSGLKNNVLTTCMLSPKTGTCIRRRSLDLVCLVTGPDDMVVSCF